MPRGRRGVTDAELDVLKVLWDRGPSTIRELTDRLYPDGQTSHYATVQKLLERLQAKRCVARRSAGRAHLFRATVDREELIEDGLRRTAERLCEGSLTPLLTHLVRASRLTEDEAARLRRLVDDLDRKRGGR
ncbi:MAG TPA: BlaI/MecI/CopY family transcriptional regulator [Candidatus Polarisedimenticolaceae bacterium]|nr:BlaI/MecI/CopY family transcriptional regulator [Candidatus Polarisedimenticolaceae bacterium]